MAGRKRRSSAPIVRSDGITPRRSRGRIREEGASFPVPPPRSDLPRGYAETLGEIKQRIRQERLRVVMSANSAMVLLYWDIGRMILDRQEREGWGANVIDRLSVDLREAYPDMRGLSPRNLKYMRSFATAWPEQAIVQRIVAQLPWRQNIALIERLDNEKARLWYAEQTLRLEQTHRRRRAGNDARRRTAKGTERELTDRGRNRSRTCRVSEKRAPSGAEDAEPLNDSPALSEVEGNLLNG